MDTINTIIGNWESLSHVEIDMASGGPLWFCSCLVGWGAMTALAAVWGGRH